MTMTETPAATPKPARKRTRRPARAAAPKPEAGEFAGITASACPAACGATRCVISGLGVCAHPRKGGLQAGQMNDQKALGRLARANDILDHG